MDILHRVGIQAPADRVYAALTARDGLAGWWTQDVQAENEVGGKLHFGFTADGVELGFFDMKVLELDPGRRVLWQVVDGPAEWIGTRIGWDLAQEGNYCIVMFRHQGWKNPVPFMSHCSTKWAVFLMSLKSLVETGKGQPSPNDVRIGDWH